MGRFVAFILTFIVLRLFCTPIGIAIIVFSMIWTMASGWTSQAIHPKNYAESVKVTVTSETPDFVGEDYFRPYGEMQYSIKIDLESMYKREFDAAIILCSITSPTTKQTTWAFGLRESIMYSHINLRPRGTMYFGAVISPSKEYFESYSLIYPIPPKHTGDSYHDQMAENNDMMMRRDNQYDCNVYENARQMEAANPGMQYDRLKPIFQDAGLM